MAEPAYKLYDPSAYHSDPEDKQWTQKHWGAGHFAHFSPTPRKRDGFGQLEMYMKAVAQLSTEKPRWQKIIERANSLANELEVSREQVYYMALAGLIEKYEEALKEHACESLGSSSYQELDECTEEEFNAILEADRSEPELAENHRDLSED